MTLQSDNDGSAKDASIDSAMLESQVLAEIGYAVSSQLDVHEVGEIAVRKLGEVLEFDRIAVATVDEAQKTASAIFSAPRPLFIPDFSEPDSFPLSGTFLGEAVTQQRPVHFGDHNREEVLDSHPVLRLSVEVGLRSKVVIPVIHAGRVAAILDVSSISKPSFEDGEVDLIARAALQIGPALINVLLRKEVAAQSKLRIGLAEIGKIVTCLLT